jgi:hypothetical protein
MMHFDSSHLKKLLVHTAKKDTGISLARAYRAWYGALCVGALMILTGGLHAGYEFMNIEAQEVVITDPVTTTRYREADIARALSRYDALQAASKKQLGEPATIREVAPAAVPAVEAKPEPVVATSSPLRVE